MWLIETVLCEMKENRQDAKRLAQIPPRSRNKDGDCERPGKPGFAVQHILLPTSRRRERTQGTETCAQQMPPSPARSAP